MLSRITFYALWARIGHEFFRTSVEFSNGSRVGKAKKCKSKKCKAEKFTTNKNNVRNCNAKKYKAKQCKAEKCRSKNGKLFLLYHARDSYLNSWHLFRDAMSFRGNTQQMPQESFRAHEAPEDPFVGSES